MKNGIFKTFGDGSLGLKAQDLNQYADLIKSVGLFIPDGIVITTEIFEQMMAYGTFDELDSSLDYPKERSAIENMTCPDFLISINEEILDGIEMNRPYAIRSSALSERGGIGIYQSTFFWPIGQREKDLKELWNCEKKVYASEFSRDAELWRKKINAPIGMAILIQPIVGSKIGLKFLPTIAGLAYTSYNGLPTVRTVVGLGSRAVDGDGFIYHHSPEYSEFSKTIFDQNVVDCISEENGLDILPVDEDLMFEIKNDFNAFCSLFSKLDVLKQKGNFYLEWAISDGKLFILQINPYEDKLPIYQTISFDTEKYFKLLEGNDLINGNNELYSGHATCKNIVLVYDWSNETARLLEDMNANMKDYLLMIPQDALSLIAQIKGNKPFSFKHFSNSLAVIERQFHFTNEQRIAMISIRQPVADHSNQTGACHFAELCDRAEILFIGASFNIKPLCDLPGSYNYSDCKGIEIWRRTAEIVVNKHDNAGYVYVSKDIEQPTYNYTRNQVQKWCFTLRDIANRESNVQLQNHLYTVHYAIEPGEKSTDYDPLKLDSDIVEEFGGIAKISESINITIANLPYLTHKYAYEEIITYLKDLLLHLK